IALSELREHGGGAHFRIVHVALHFDERDWRRGKRPVRIWHPVSRILPPLIAQTPWRRAGVLDEAVAIEIAVAVDPLHRPSNVRQQLADQRIVSRPTPCLLQQYEPERRGVDG